MIIQALTDNCQHKLNTCTVLNNVTMLKFDAVFQLTGGQKQSEKLHCPLKIIVVYSEHACLIDHQPQLWI